MQGLEDVMLLKSCSHPGRTRVILAVHRDLYGCTWGIHALTVKLSFSLQRLPFARSTEPLLMILAWQSPLFIHHCFWKISVFIGGLNPSTVLGTLSLEKQKLYFPQHFMVESWQMVLVCKGPCPCTIPLPSKVRLLLKYPKSNSPLLEILKEFILIS